MTSLWNKTILNLFLKEDIFRNYVFLVEVTFILASLKFLRLVSEVRSTTEYIT